MYLDDLRMDGSDVRELRRDGEELTVRLGWDWRDLPYLLTLPSRTNLRWGHHDDGRAGLPVRVITWRWHPPSSQATGEGTVELRLQLGADGANAEGRTAGPGDGRPGPDRVSAR